MRFLEMARLMASDCGISSSELDNILTQNVFDLVYLDHLASRLNKQEAEIFVSGDRSDINNLISKYKLSELDDALEMILCRC